MKKIVLLVCFLVSGVTQASFPDLAASKMSLGGSAAFVSKLEFDHQYYLDIKLNPSVSYMVADGWELGVRPFLEIKLFRPFKLIHNVTWGMSTFFRKYFVLHERYSLYTGAHLGINIFDTNWKMSNAFAGGEIGVLIGLNEHVAIDIGLPVSAHFSATRFNRLEFPLGFFGLKAFF